MDHSLMEPQYPLLSEGKLRMLWRGTLKEHRPREETYSEYMIYVYSNIRLSMPLYPYDNRRVGYTKEIADYIAIYTDMLLYCPPDKKPFIR